LSLGVLSLQHLTLRTPRCSAASGMIRKPTCAPRHPSASTDAQLIEQFLGGDDEAFKKLLNRYVKQIYNFLYQLTKDTSSLDDLSQETFLKAWKNLRRFDKSKNFQVWLFAIAKNTAYDFLRKQKRAPVPFYEDEEIAGGLEEITDNEPLPHELHEKKELKQELAEKLGEIPESYRLVLLMRYKDDFSIAEIAEILNKPYNTVKSHHLRALQALRKVL